MSAPDFAVVPIIDVAPLLSSSADHRQTAEALGQACRDCGFFYVVGHGVDESLLVRLERLSREFFARDEPSKMRIAMPLGGRAWRGYFPVGGELTSGKPDLKEGLYFGEELANDHPLVQAATPMHGRNLFPDDLPEFREVVLETMKALTRLGHAIMGGLALSLGLPETYFANGCMSHPLTLFRIFNYPSDPNHDPSAPRWGVGEHTDYGVLTILRQDDAGGLQVKSRDTWIEAPPIPESFVCNIGDMLDRMTGGIYRSTPHRVLNRSNRNRISLPFFFDPNFDAEIQPIVSFNVGDDKEERWDKASVHEFQGTYGEYLLNKVAKVFPQLRGEVLEDRRPLMEGNSQA
jgi:isopenicillin N synthase-like dioxygenase